MIGEAHMWLALHHQAVAADVHHRHRLDWYRMRAGAALVVADQMAATPGTVTYSAVTERRALRMATVRAVQAAQVAPAPGPHQATRRDIRDAGGAHSTELMTDTAHAEGLAERLGVPA